MSQLGLIGQMRDYIMKLLNTNRFAIIIMAQILGVFVFLKSVWKGYQEKKMHFTAGV